MLGVFGAVAVAGPACGRGRKCRLSTWPGAAEHRWSRAQDSMYCFGFNSAKEREKTEREQCKARSPEGVPQVQLAPSQRCRESRDLQGITWDTERACAQLG